MVEIGVRGLEVGFGEGFFLDWFAGRGWDVRGIDFTDDGLRAFFPHLIERVTVGDAFALLDALLAANFERAVHRLISCFEERARALYGAGA